MNSNNLNSTENNYTIIRKKDEYKGFPYSLDFKIDNTTNMVTHYKFKGPGFLYYLYISTFSFLWYVFFMTLCVYGVTQHFSWLILMPTAPLTVNGILITIARVREGIASENEWSEPVMRQRTGIYWIYLIIGGFNGGLAGWLIYRTITFIQTHQNTNNFIQDYWLLLIIAGTIWEIRHSGRKIPEFDQPD